MKKLLVVVLLATISLGLSSFTYAPKLSLEGSWVGQFQSAVTDASVRTNFWTENGEMKGTIDIPSEGVYGLGLSWIIFDSSYVHFELVRESQTFVFDGQVKNGLITGNFSLRAERGTFRLTRDSLVMY